MEGFEEGTRVWLDGKSPVTVVRDDGSDMVVVRFIDGSEGAFPRTTLLESELDLAGRLARLVAALESQYGTISTYGDRNGRKMAEGLAWAIRSIRYEFEGELPPPTVALPPP